MALFHFGKREKEVKKPVCACDAPIEGTKEKNCCGDGALETEIGNYDYVDAGILCIKVLGSGCRSCHEMYENTKKAVETAGLDIEVEYVTDMEKIMEYGIMSMPGLVINEKVVSVGKILKPADVESMLHKLGF